MAGKTTWQPGDGQCPSPAHASVKMKPRAYRQDRDTGSDEHHNGVHKGVITGLNRDDSVGWGCLQRLNVEVGI